MTTLSLANKFVHVVDCIEKVFILPDMQLKMDAHDLHLYKYTINSVNTPIVYYYISHLLGSFSIIRHASM